jgi:peptidoglycan/xylan/chitin deacetylase (PgdA/CDA1 family)
LVLFVLGLSACSGLPESEGTIKSTQLNTAAPTNYATVVLKASDTPQPTITSTITVTASPTTRPTEYPLLGFEYKFKPAEISSHPYLTTCDYLTNRWNPEKSKPGTIIVPVMYHSIRQRGRELQDNMQVTQDYFEYSMSYAKTLGFETITTDELVGFLYQNDPIPERSMILIIDDRRLGVVRDHFMAFLNANDWTLTLAYITGIARADEWQEFERLNVDGRLDLQAHGFYHNQDTYITQFTPLEVVREEIYNPIPVIEEHTGKKPLAFIWPGGNYTKEAVEIAREAGYRVGFTIQSRGPIMFNWIPLGLEESQVNDPLMVLPRIWSNSITLDLDRAVLISESAKEFALQNKTAEYEWFQIYCSDYPPLPDLSINDE